MGCQTDKLASLEVFRWLTSRIYWGTRICVYDWSMWMLLGKRIHRSCVRTTLQVWYVSLSKYILFSPFSSPSLPPFSSPLYCQEGPPLKVQFSTAWHRHRQTSTAVTTVSQFAIKEVLEKILFYVHVEGARILQWALGGGVEKVCWPELHLIGTVLRFLMPR